MMRAMRGYTVKMMLKGGGGNEFELEKRAGTLENPCGKALFAIIWTIAGLMSLKEMNFDVRPLLAGAGVAGVALGFGAQNIIKDCPGRRVPDAGESDPRQRRGGDQRQDRTGGRD
jgi:small conductance mechanosensitive channel